MYTLCSMFCIMLCNTKHCKIEHGHNTGLHGSTYMGLQQYTWVYMVLQQYEILPPWNSVAIIYVVIMEVKVKRQLSIMPYTWAV